MKCNSGFPLEVMAEEETFIVSICDLKYIHTFGGNSVSTQLKIQKVFATWLSYSSSQCDLFYCVFVFFFLSFF